MTTPVAMRFTAADLAILDALKARLGLISRIDVVRLAMRRLAQIEHVEVASESTSKK